MTSYYVRFISKSRVSHSVGSIEFRGREHDRYADARYRVYLVTEGTTPLRAAIESAHDGSQPLFETSDTPFPADPNRPELVVPVDLTHVDDRFLPIP